MKFNRCPICHCCFDVMAMAQDEATQQVLVRLARFDTLTGIALLGYLSLFCPKKSQLSSGRTLTLLNELDQLADGDWARLAVAMSITVETMQDQKRNGQPAKQFKNHHYLLKVLDSVPADAGNSIAPVKAPVSTRQSQPRPQSSTMASLQTLEEMKYE